MRLIGRGHRRANSLLQFLHVFAVLNEIVIGVGVGGVRSSTATIGASPQTSSKSGASGVEGRKAAKQCPFVVPPAKCDCRKERGKETYHVRCSDRTDDDDTDDDSVDEIEDDVLSFSVKTLASQKVFYRFQLLRRSKNDESPQFLSPLKPSDILGSSRLTALDLSGASFGDIGGTAVDLLRYAVSSDLVELVLSYCQLTEVPSKNLGAGALSHLTTLDLQSNDIVALRSNDFVATSALEILNLAENNISTIDRHAFRSLMGLRELILSDNRLKSLEASVFATLANLTLLYLDGNLLESLPDRLFHHLHSLKKLHLASNRLASISVSLFHGLRHLESLSMHNNPIVYLKDSTFKWLAHLKHLSLDVASLPDPLSPRLFVGLRRLEFLDMGEVNRTELPVGLFHDVPKLRRLSLTDYASRLRGISLGVFTTSVDLHNFEVGVEPLSGHTCARADRCAEKWIASLVGQHAFVHASCLDSKSAKETKFTCRKDRKSPWGKNPFRRSFR